MTSRFDRMSQELTPREKWPSSPTMPARFAALAELAETINERGSAMKPDRSMHFSDSDKAQVLDVMLDVLHKGGIIRGRKAKLVWVDGQPTLRPIVVEGPRKKKKEEPA